MNNKSSTCFSKRDNKPLSEFDSQEDAQENANYANTKYDSNLAPYLCHKCNKWHLSPKDRMTPSEQCHTCTDSNGQGKALYRNRKEAEQRAKILKKEQGVNLYVYECPVQTGYHLTKNEHSF